MSTDAPHAPPRGDDASVGDASALQSLEKQAGGACAGDTQEERSNGQGLPPPPSAVAALATPGEQRAAPLHAADAGACTYVAPHAAGEALAERRWRSLAVGAGSVLTAAHVVEAHAATPLSPGGACVPLHADVGLVALVPQKLPARGAALGARDGVCTGALADAASSRSSTHAATTVAAAEFTHEARDAAQLAAVVPSPATRTLAPHRPPACPPPAWAAAARTIAGGAPPALHAAVAAAAAAANEAATLNAAPAPELAAAAPVPPLSPPPSPPSPPPPPQSLDADSPPPPPPLDEQPTPFDACLLYASRAQLAAALAAAHAVPPPPPPTNLAAVNTAAVTLAAAVQATLPSLRAASSFLDVYASLLARGGAPFAACAAVAACAAAAARTLLGAQAAVSDAVASGAIMLPRAALAAATSHVATLSAEFALPYALAARVYGRAALLSGARALELSRRSLAALAEHAECLRAGGHAGATLPVFALLCVDAADAGADDVAAGQRAFAHAVHERFGAHGVALLAQQRQQQQLLQQQQQLHQELLLIQQQHQQQQQQRAARVELMTLNHLLQRQQCAPTRTPLAPQVAPPAGPPAASALRSVNVLPPLARQSVRLSSWQDGAAGVALQPPPQQQQQAPPAAAPLPQPPRRLRSQLPKRHRLMLTNDVEIQAEAAPAEEADENAHVGAPPPPPLRSPVPLADIRSRLLLKAAARIAAATAAAQQQLPALADFAAIVEFPLPETADPPLPQQPQQPQQPQHVEAAAANLDAGAACAAAVHPQLPFGVRLPSFMQQPPVLPGHECDARHELERMFLQLEDCKWVHPARITAAAVAEIRSWRPAQDALLGVRAFVVAVASGCAPGAASWDAALCSACAAAGGGGDTGNGGVRVRVRGRSVSRERLRERERSRSRSRSRSRHRSHHRSRSRERQRRSRSHERRRRSRSRPPRQRGSLAVLAPPSTQQQVPKYVPPGAKFPFFPTRARDDLPGVIAALRTAGWVGSAHTHLHPGVLTTLAGWQPAAAAAAALVALPATAAPHLALATGGLSGYALRLAGQNAAATAAVAGGTRAGAPAAGRAERHEASQRSRHGSRSRERGRRASRSASRGRTRSLEHRSRHGGGREKRRRSRSRSRSRHEGAQRNSSRPPLPTAPVPTAAAASAAPLAPVRPPPAAPQPPAPPFSPPPPPPAAVRFHYRNPQSGAVERLFKLSVFRGWLAAGALTAADAARLRVWPAGGEEGAAVALASLLAEDAARG
jgi:hypothetical protein